MAADATGTLGAGSNQFGILHPPGAYILVPENAQEVYIDPTPALPKNITAYIKGVNGVSNYTFTWNAAIDYTPRYNSAKPLHLDQAFMPTTKNSLGQGPTDLGQFFLTLMGGNLTLSATTTQSCLAGYSIPPIPNNKEITIYGTNPTSTDVINRLTFVNDLTLANGVVVSAADLTKYIRAISIVESTRLQFAPKDDYQGVSSMYEGEPYQATDGGIGIMQMTNNGGGWTDLYRIQLLWDWRANVDAGMALFENQKLYNIAYRYPGNVWGDPSYQTYLGNTNAWRASKGLKPLFDIYVRAFNSEQLLRDASRLYNGTGGLPDQFHNSLHEYMLQTHVEPGFGIVIDTNPDFIDPNNSNQLVAWSIWTEVTTAQRIALGQSPNTANYVDKVIAALGQ